MDVKRLTELLRDAEEHHGAYEATATVHCVGGHEEPFGDFSVGQAFAKLGINSRVELARLARDHEQG